MSRLKGIWDWLGFFTFKPIFYYNREMVGRCQITVYSSFIHANTCLWRKIHLKLQQIAYFPFSACRIKNLLYKIPLPRYQHLHLDLLHFIDMPINFHCLCTLLFFYWSPWIHAITLSGVTGSRSDWIVMTHDWKRELNCGWRCGWRFVSFLAEYWRLWFRTIGRFYIYYIFKWFRSLSTNTLFCILVETCKMSKGGNGKDSELQQNILMNW